MRTFSEEKKMHSDERLKPQFLLYRSDIDRTFAAA